MENTEAKNVIKKKNWFLAFFNDKSKTNLKWWNRNYFYAGTFFFAALCIILFAALGQGWSLKLFDKSANYDNFKIVNFFNGLFGSMDHSGGWQHILLNMLCYLFVSIYLERKYGTINYLSLTVFICFFSRMANMLVLQHYGTGEMYLYGFSSANYALYAIFFVDFFFSFRKSKRNLTNTILGSILVVVLYVVMCFNGGTTNFSFKFYPVDFIENSWHWAGFGTGILTGLLIQITSLNYEYLYKNKTNLVENISEKGKRKKKKKEKVLKEETQESVVVEKKKSKKTKTKKDKKLKVTKEKQVKKHKEERVEKKKTEVPVEKIEQSPVKNVTEDKVEAEKVQVATPDKKLTALPEDMKNVPARKPYRKKKKVVSKTPPLVIKPVVAKQSKTVKKSDNK